MSQLIEGYELSKDNTLLFEKEKVAAVYFRTAYSPAHYLT